MLAAKCCFCFCCCYWQLAHLHGPFLTLSLSLTLSSCLTFLFASVSPYVNVCRSRPPWNHLCQAERTHTNVNRTITRTGESAPSFRTITNTAWSNFFHLVVSRLRHAFTLTPRHCFLSLSSVLFLALFSFSKLTCKCFHLNNQNNW